MQALRQEIFPKFTDKFDLMQRHFAAGDNFSVASELVNVFNYFNNISLFSLNKEQVQYIDRLTGFILFILTDQRFYIPNGFKETFASNSVLIGHMAYISRYKTTDAALQKLISENGSVDKIFPLYSHFNNVKIDLDKIFQSEPQLASIWWGYVISTSRNSNSEAIKNNLSYFTNYQNLEKYFVASPEVIEKFTGTILPYFNSSYFDEGSDKKVKNIINKTLKKIFPPAKLGKNYDLKKVLVVSQNFHVKHAVYKSISPLIRELKGSYKLGLLNLNENDNIELPDFFDEVINPKKENILSFGDVFNMVKNKGYGTIIFPDIGMSQPSVIFSNLRLSPIQITCYGHPVSTFGGEVDYFIGGSEVELKEFANKNYSEKLILIDGLAAKPVFPEYKLKNPKRSFNEVTINLNWGSTKFNFDHLSRIKKIAAATDKNIVLRFSSIAADRLAMPVFMNQFVQFFNEKNIKLAVTPYIDYPQYMEMIEDSDFAIDSFPFGGYNRILDGLYAGKPIVTLEGNKAQNRLASAILRKIGLSELISTNDEELVKISLKLIENDNYRAEISEKIRNINLKEILGSDSKEKSFKQAIDKLVVEYK